MSLDHPGGLNLGVGTIIQVGLLSLPMSELQRPKR